LLQGIGRGIRKPTIEAMLSYTTGKHGRGWVYAVHTSLDHAGRTVGPLFIALVLFLNGEHQTGYALLLIPCTLALAFLTFARVTFPVPSRLEERREEATTRSFSPSYWLYMSAGICFAGGVMSFELISYHLTSARLATGHGIPLFLALGTASGAITSLTLGKLYDRRGLSIVLVAVVLSSLFSPFIFLGNHITAFLGMVLWGVGQVVQDMLFKTIVSGVLPQSKRNFAFGLFYTGYGFGWLAGSVATGLLYGVSRVALVIFAVAVQLISIPLFILAARRTRR
jgi:MFS family permease